MLADGDRAHRLAHQDPNGIKQDLRTRLFERAEDEAVKVFAAT